MPTRSLAAALAALLLLAPPAGATWSIIVADRSTGEIAVGCATCLEGFDLTRYVPVVVVGKGAAAAQSQVDQNGVNRKKIWDALHAGIAPPDIIDLVKQGDVFKCSRQYGIVDMNSQAAGFTGACSLPFKKHITGTVGDLTYAIQGNVLTGLPVIEAARDAVLGTEGRLCDRLMAGMLAAYAMGGDGRCSCAEDDPTACGAPPPEFEKSAHVGFMIVARAGDTDGVCGGVGCANGDYWMRLNVVGIGPDPDPVLQLQAQYGAWLERMAGRPDGVNSSATWAQGGVVRGDGRSTRDLQLVLYDIDGQPITEGGALVDVQHAEDSAGLSQRLAVIDHGDGTYTVRLQAGTGAGVDRFAIRVSDGGGRGATLFPYPTLEHVAPTLAR